MYSCGIFVASLVKCLFKYLLIFGELFGFLLLSFVQWSNVRTAVPCPCDWWEILKALGVPVGVTSQGDGLVPAVDGEACRAEASPGEGLARAFLWSGLAVRELQASKGQRPGNRGPRCQMNSFFFLSTTTACCF